MPLLNFIMPQETPIDVSRESVARLRDMGNLELAAAMAIHGDGSHQCAYWDGYLRAIEHVFEMENE